MRGVEQILVFQAIAQIQVIALPCCQFIERSNHQVGTTATDLHRHRFVAVLAEQLHLFHSFVVYRLVEYHDDIVARFYLDLVMLRERPGCLKRIAIELLELKVHVGTHTQRKVRADFGGTAKHVQFQGSKHLEGQRTISHIHYTDRLDMHQVLVYRGIAPRLFRMHGKVKIHIDKHRRIIVIGLETLGPIGVGYQIAGHVGHKGANDVAGKHGRSHLATQLDRINTGNAQLLAGTGNHGHRVHMHIRSAHPAFQYQRHGIHLGHTQCFGNQVELVKRQPVQARGLRVARIPLGRLRFHQLLDGRIEIDHVILGQRGRQLIGHCLQHVFVKIFQTLQGECVGVAADQVLFGVQGDVVALIENPDIHQFPGLLMLQLDRVTVTDGGLHQRLGEGDAHRREIHERETLFCNRLRQIGPGILLVDSQYLGNPVGQRVVLAGAKRNQRAVLIIQVDDAGGDLRGYPQPILFTGAQT